jgi:two-component system, chemotaxis family, protein-glutamate methylesterase/glutaminase
MSASGHSACLPGFRFVAVVASLGGLPVLRALVAGLPASFPAPVLAVWHRMPGNGHDSLAELLRHDAALPVRTATPGLSAWGSGITVIPGGQSATMTGDHQMVLRATATGGGSGNTLLTSIATAALPGPVIGVILSGKLHDGAEGVRSIKRHGGRVLVQDPATARAASMPASAIATGCIDFVLPPHRIAAALIALAMAPGGASLLTVPSPHWAARSPT